MIFLHFIKRERPCKNQALQIIRKKQGVFCYRASLKTAFKTKMTCKSETRKETESRLALGLFLLR